MDRELIAWLFAAAQTLLFIAAAPLLAGWVQRVKCHMQNRSAPAPWQPYRDLAKLFGKQMVLAGNASWLFRVTPYIVFGAMLLAASVMPLIVVQVPTAAIADVIVLVGFFALARFFTALAGLDIGTAFGGMGASREMMVAALAEPAMLMVVFTFSMTAHTTNLSVATAYIVQQGLLLRPSFLFALLALAMVAVAEASRIPVDNPATHLELTMLHEAMILEYGGRHLALIEWASYIKLMIYAMLIINFAFPWGIALDFSMAALALGVVTVAAKLMLLAVVLVIWETVLAKMRLFRVPQFLGFAFMLSVLAMLTQIMLEASS
ncbi:NADH-quinone oxidoreductase subunit H [Rhodoferax sp.]|uniref:respiratory chain complex I subunit 1 family protein n=1 Tax=Rhodoferax sp. TaxID=50421 RepID=UPI001A0BCE40|nr:NADH-quinone oxidoreductase subunit H [Rhodoferax sp.]MBE0473782.1 NADH-quinone oxidoreductase subunit H [Rhodoferax sp.]